MKLLLTPDASGANAALLFGRVAAVIALFPNGLHKIMSFEQLALAIGGTPQMLNGSLFPEQTPLFAFPFPQFFLGGSIIFDLLGAFLIVIGWRTRQVAAFMAVYVALAILIFNSEIRFFGDVIYLLRGAPFLGTLAILAALGGGYWSLDGLSARKRSAV